MCHFFIQELCSNLIHRMSPYILHISASPNVSCASLYSCIMSHVKLLPEEILLFLLPYGKWTCQCCTSESASSICAPYYDRDPCIYLYQTLFCLYELLYIITYICMHFMVEYAKRLFTVVFISNY